MGVIPGYVSIPFRRCDTFVMTLLQLSPSLPVYVTSNDNAEATALFLLDYSREDDMYFVVGMIDTGEIWVVPQTEIRLGKNWTLGNRT